jgi:hypothetical protein
MSACTSRSDVVALGLWDPIWEGSKYIGELERKDRALSNRAASLGSPEDELLGFPLNADLKSGIDSFSVSNFVESLTENVLVIQSKDEMTAGDVEQIKRLAKKRHSQLTVPGPSFWEDDSSQLVPRASLDAIVAWASKELA